MTGERKTELDKDALEKASYAWCRLNSGNVACEEQEITCVNCIGHVTPIITAYLTALPQSALSSRLAEFLIALADDEGREGNLDNARNLREAAAALGGIPEGWKLVPVEPTFDMLPQAWRTVRRRGGQGVDHDCLRAIYRDMLAAAPPLTPGEQK